MSFIIGVDLGQAQDYTALVVLEREARATGETESIYRPATRIWHDGRLEAGRRSDYLTVPVTKNYFAARHLERLPLGTSYPAQVERVKAVFCAVKGDKQLVVDQTGVGRPVIDMLKAARLPVRAVTITGGDTVSRDGNGYRVPKRDLVSTVQVLLQSDRLKIAKALPEAQTLVDELVAFKVTIGSSGHDRYGNDVGAWRENAHDDLVLATALACWYGQNKPPIYTPPRTIIRNQ